MTDQFHNPEPTEEQAIEEIPIGKTSATEREASTSDKFSFWLPDGIIVNPFDIVAVQQVNQPDKEASRTYGLVTMLEHRTDAPNHLANFMGLWDSRWEPPPVGCQPNNR
jgi:hypothetical protein